MYLLILESIGTSELILIAIVALIVFGPRKLPQMMKTVGKTMAEFRNATNEFKTTWEREVTLHENSPEDKANSLVNNPIEVENAVAKGPGQAFDNAHLPPPEVKALSAEDISKNFPERKTAIEQSQSGKIIPEKTNDKTDWL